MKSLVSEIFVKQIRINQGVGVQNNFGLFFLSYCYSKKLWKVQEIHELSNAQWVNTSPNIIHILVHRKNPPYDFFKRSLVSVLLSVFLISSLSVSPGCSHLQLLKAVSNQFELLLEKILFVSCPVFLLLKNPINRLPLHQFLGTKTTEVNKSLNTDANEAY